MLVLMIYNSTSEIKTYPYLDILVLIDYTIVLLIYYNTYDTNISRRYKNKILMKIVKANISRNGFSNFFIFALASTVTIINK